MTATPDSTASPETFQDLGLGEPLLKALTKLGYERPSPIQAATIPLLLQGVDLIGQAQTGTGKTAAFALPILNGLGNPSKHPVALVICPTRELAIQVAEAFQSYARFLKQFHVLPVYGGQDMQVQLRHLKRGVDVVVGTPGRLLDHLKRGTLDLSGLRTVVLDEADEMLRMGFIDDVEAILASAGGDQQTVLFSATLPEPIRRVAERFLKDPSLVRIAATTATVDAIDQRYWLLHKDQKLAALTRLLEVEETDGVMIFTRTRETTTELAEKISARGFLCAAINGDMSQSAREQTIRRLKNGQIDILVATDVAARGLDVDRISHVINYDIPHDTESYIHRIGRTGRAGRKGSAILLLTPREQRLLRAIEKATRQNIAPIQLPTAEDVMTQRVQRFKETVYKALEQRPAPLFASLVTEICEESGASPSAVAAAMAELLQKDKPLTPGPEFKQPAMAKPASARENRPKHKARGAAESVEMDTYRIEVGREHAVTPENIVGAIANEIEIDSRHIGQIRIFDDFSTVELPSGMPRDIFQFLKRVRVRGRPMNLSLFEGKPGRRNDDGKAGKRPPSGKKKKAADKARD